MTSVSLRDRNLSRLQHRRKEKVRQRLVMRSQTQETPKPLKTGRQRELPQNLWREEQPANTSSSGFLAPFSLFAVGYCALGIGCVGMSVLTSSQTATGRVYLQVARAVPDLKHYFSDTSVHV